MTKNLKLSQWHDGSVKPTRKGVYETLGEGFDDICWSYFDGKIFNGRWFSNHGAYDNRDFGKGLTIMQWRGIVK